MVDFAKEARDLVWGRDYGLHHHDKLRADFEDFGRRMHAAGVAEGLATAAAIARDAAKAAAEKHNAARTPMERERWAAVWKQASDIVAAILAASPPPAAAPPPSKAPE